MKRIGYKPWVQLECWHRIKNYSFWSSAVESQCVKFSKLNFRLCYSLSSCGAVFFFLFALWVAERGCQSPRNTHCAPSCVLVSGPPPVHPSWVSLYHPSTLLSHHTGKGERGQNPSLANIILARGGERCNMRGSNFSVLYGGWIGRDTSSKKTAV